MLKKYSVYSFLTLSINIIYIFTILNSRVLGNIGDLNSLAPFVIVVLLSILAIIFSIINLYKGGSKLISSILILLSFLPVVLILLGSLLGGVH